jgi:hemolysin activation/secretion protein
MPLSTPSHRWLAGGLMLLGLNAQAQIDAGALQQQIERNQVLRLPRLLAPAPAPAPRVQRAPGGPSVTLSRFVIRGNTLLPEAQLQAALTPFLGRPLSFSELEDAAAEVGQGFRAQGWTVRVFLPEQDIVQGTAIIEVVEATLGQVRSEGEVAPPSSLPALRQIIEASQAPGTFLNTQRVDRGLLITNDISGVNVAGQVLEGEGQAQTDLLLKTLAKPWAEFNLSRDNTGSYGTGPNRLAALVNFNHFLQPGGVLSTQLAHTAGSKYARLGLSLPVGHEGWRWSVNSSKLYYNVVNLPKEVQGKGNSDTYGAELSYPLVRARNRNLSVILAVDEKKFENYDPLGLLSSNYSSRVYGLAVQGNRETDWAGLSGALTGNLTLSSGVLNLRGSRNEDTQAKDANPAGYFHKLRMILSQEQSLLSDLSVYGAFSGQWTGKNLDSSEKFSLGGASGVRAYGSGEASGALGRMLNLELRWRVNPGLTLTQFYDVGRVRTNVRNAYPGAPEINVYGLRGRGMSMNWQAFDAVSLRVVWARRQGVNPKPNDVTGKDQDGTLVKNRAWLSANAAF